ncbi:MAG: EGF domain-containing protein [Polyangiales bacterium]
MSKLEMRSGWLVVGMLLGVWFVPAEAAALPTYGVGDYGARPYVCQTCHVASGGGTECQGNGRAPCLNPYGARYYSAGYVATTGENQDGDSWTNSYEINTGGGSSPMPGWPEGATEVGCSMEACAYAVAAGSNSVYGSYVNCGQNVECRAYHTSSQRYYFNFRCELGTTGTAGTSSHNWGCSDTNECLGNPCSPGTCNQTAIGNSWTSPGYYCTGCPAGYALNGTGTACLLINECTANVDNCHALATCYDPSSATGNYTCTCPPGYSGNGRTGIGNTGCTDINECAGNPCGPNGVSCTQTPIGSWSAPGYSCTCAANYGFNGTTCVLTNECTAVPAPCVAGLTTCNDPTPSMNNGDVQCTCIAGYTGNGRVNGTGCTNINECTSGMHNCHALASCADTPGSFTCTCSEGTTGNGTTCANINECAPQPCGPGGTCTQIPLGRDWEEPGYTCACRSGYTNNGTTCVLQDECAARLADCVSLASCSDPTPAVNDYECTCAAGYTGDGRASGSRCTNINECDNDEDNCASDATCTDTQGSFTCACNEGFEGNGEVCTDVDECSRGTHDCSPFAECANTAGSFSCTCRDGFQGTGTSCIDVDECVVDNPCGDNELCINQLGDAPQCVCEPGFTRVDGLCTRACGDGVRGLGEGCDDANTDPGDGCDERCRVETGWACYEPASSPSVCTNHCGDGLIDYPAEVCDEGEANSDTAPDACRMVCQPAFCGDGVVDSGEDCDEGEANSPTLVDACRPTCQRAFCGDGIVDTGEVCDPGEGDLIDPTRCVAGCFVDAGVSRGHGGCVAAPRGAAGNSGVWAIVLLGIAIVRRRRR